MSPGSESRWEFLAARYDADTDGRIVEAEYPRGSESFARLDADGDRSISAGDFATDQGSASEMTAQALLFRYFSDGRESGPTTASVAETARRFDADGDQHLSHAELERLFAARGGEEYSTLMEAMLAGQRETDTLLGVLDADGDDRLSTVELNDYHRERYDETFAQVLDSGVAPAEWMRPGGPAPGTIAPDFTLSTPDGGEVHRLSAFAGKKPVALVFGSYT